MMPRSCGASITTCTWRYCNRLLQSWDLRILSQLWHASDRYTRIVFETYNVSDTERKRRYDAHRVLAGGVAVGVTVRDTDGSD